MLVVVWKLVIGYQNIRSGTFYPTFLQLLLLLLLLMLLLPKVHLLPNFNQTLETFCHFGIEALRLLHENLLNLEEVPVLTHTLQQLVEELVELLLEAFSDEDDIIPQCDLMFSNRRGDDILDLLFPYFYIFQGCVNL